MVTVRDHTPEVVAELRGVTLARCSYHCPCGSTWILERPVGTVLGIADITGFNLSSLVVAVFGAIVVILVARMFTLRGARSTAS